MDIWLRDNPLSEYIRREVLLDVSFTAASFRTLDSISGGSQTLVLAAVTDSFHRLCRDVHKDPSLKTLCIMHSFQL